MTPQMVNAYPAGANKVSYLWLISPTETEENTPEFEA